MSPVTLDLDVLMLPDYLIDYEDWLRSIGWEPPPAVLRRSEPVGFDWGDTPEFWRDVYRWDAAWMLSPEWGGDSWTNCPWGSATAFDPDFHGVFPPPRARYELPDGTPVTLALILVVGHDMVSLTVSLDEPFTNALFDYDALDPSPVVPIAADLSHLVRALRELTERGYLNHPVTHEPATNALPADTPRWFFGSKRRSPHDGFDELLPWYRRLP